MMIHQSSGNPELVCPVVKRPERGAHYPRHVKQRFRIPEANLLRSPCTVTLCITQISNFDLSSEKSNLISNTTFINNLVQILLSPVFLSPRFEQLKENL
jgi:hypothetical protein